MLLLLLPPIRLLVRVGRVFAELPSSSTLRFNVRLAGSMSFLEVVEAEVEEVEASRVG